MIDNLVIQYFVKGGWVMWPILITSIVTIFVVLERTLWWIQQGKKREAHKLDLVYGALEKGDVKTASNYARSSEDPLLRIIWHGLNHHHASLQGALQVAAGIELKRAGRFILILDTVVTLAPLLGLLGTVTGLIKAFFKLGDVELSEQAIGGGIAEALIATASGLVIAVIALIALNYLSARLANFQFEIETAATNTEVLVNGAQVRARKGSLLYEDRLTVAA